MAIGVGNAKTIFLGEHFVVYGGQAIGFGLDKKIEVEVVRSAEMVFDFNADTTLRLAGKRIQNLLGVGNFEIKIVDSRIPAAGGLGSSAALAVAIIRAVSGEFQLDLDDKKVCDLAYEAEKIFHGTPSGIDNTLSVWGGCVLFQKRQGGNLIERLSIKGSLPLVLIDTGVKGQTKELVAQVRSLINKDKRWFGDLFKKEQQIVEEAIICLAKGDLAGLGQLMNLNQDLLRQIGVSHPKNDQVISLAQSFGALGAKLVGAGGGGYCVALMKSAAEAADLIEGLKNSYSCFFANVIS